MSDLAELTSQTIETLGGGDNASKKRKTLIATLAALSIGAVTAIFKTAIDAIKK